MGKEMIFLGVAVVFVAVIVGYADILELNKWNEFKTEHSCKISAHIKGEAFNTFDGRNVGVGFTSDKTGWACDDGQTYFR